MISGDKGDTGDAGTIIEKMQIVNGELLVTYNE